jgi:hypothetical protein
MQVCWVWAMPGGHLHPEQSPGKQAGRRLLMLLLRLLLLLLAHACSCTLRPT